MSSQHRPSFGRRGLTRPKLMPPPFVLTLPMNRFNIFSDIVRIYGHNCFHHRNMTKARAMLYAHIYDNNRDNIETCIRGVVDDALEFARSVSPEKPDTAIEVLFIGAHLCEKYQTQTGDLLLSIIRLHVEIFNSRMEYFRRRAWMMCIEERLWVRRYSLARFFSFLNVILPEVAGGNGMDNLYPHIYPDEEDDAIIPFLSNFTLTTKHLQALDFFLSIAKIEVEFQLAHEFSAIPQTQNHSNFSTWSALSHPRALTPLEFGNPDDQMGFDDFYTYSQVPGPARMFPRDIEYRWRLVTNSYSESAGDCSRTVPSGHQCSPSIGLPTYADASPNTTHWFSTDTRRNRLGAVRFVDYPVKTPLTYTTALGLACQASHPAAVKLLLQHGATPLFNNRRNRSNRLLQSLEEPFGIVTRILNRGRSWRNCTIETISQETLSKLVKWEVEEEQRIIQIIQYMIRAVNYVPIKFYSDKNEYSSSFISDGAYKDPSNGTITFQLHERFQEIIPVESMSGAPRLAQLCRYTIREVLGQHWTLKNGIEELPVPQMLKDYLSLEM